MTDPIADADSVRLGLSAFETKGKLYVGKVIRITNGNDGYFEFEFEGGSETEFLRVPMNDYWREIVPRISIGETVIVGENGAVFPAWPQLMEVLVR